MIQSFISFLILIVTLIAMTLFFRLLFKVPATLPLKKLILRSSLFIALIRLSVVASIYGTAKFNEGMAHLPAFFLHPFHPGHHGHHGHQEGGQ